MDSLPIVTALLEINDTLTNDNPFVVYGPQIMDGDDPPSEGLGIILSPVGSGAINFPGNPGSLYTFSINANNVCQLFVEQNTDGFYWRVWDNVGAVWLSWATIASEVFVTSLVEAQHVGVRGGVDYWTGLNLGLNTTIRSGIVGAVGGTVVGLFDNTPGVIDRVAFFEFEIVAGGGITEVIPDNEAGWLDIELTAGGVLRINREFAHSPAVPFSATVHYHWF